MFETLISVENYSVFLLKDVDSVENYWFLDLNLDKLGWFILFKGDWLGFCVRGNSLFKGGEIGQTLLIRYQASCELTLMFVLFTCFYPWSKRYFAFLDRILIKSWVFDPFLSYFSLFARRNWGKRGANWYTVFSLELLTWCNARGEMVAYSE